MSRYKSQVREVINRNTFVTLALDQGFNAYLPVYDGGIDFILYRESSNKDGQASALHKVQLKGGWVIDKKYIGRKISIAFPVGEIWYLIPHDTMVDFEMKNGVGKTASWREKGFYYKGKPSKAVMAFCQSYRFGMIGEVATAAATDAATEMENVDAAQEPDINDRIIGSMLGGAVGDALGAAVEFLKLREIRAKYGPEGLRSYAPAHGRVGAITDDTQMTMFTAEGLLRASVRAAEKGMWHTPGVVHHAYLRWLLTQGERPKADVDIGTDGWLFAVRGLHHRRAPGNTCLSALRAAEGFGAPERARNDSKGCGGVMRAAPVGLLAPVLGDDEKVFDLATAVAGLTHGHPSGHLSAGYLAVTIAALLRGEPLQGALAAADRQLAPHEGAGEVVAALAKATALAASGRPTPEQIESLGGGWVGEEALSIAVCCALAARDLEDGLLLAANHSGDSDSTAALAGNLLGALHGRKALPAPLIEGLELRSEIERLAADLATVSAGVTGAPWRTAALPTTP